MPYGTFSDGPLRPKRAAVKTVLLLEDDALSLALYKRVLSREYSVVATDGPHEALRLSASEAPDLFIADNVLASPTSGVRTLHDAHKRNRWMKLLLVSGTPPEGLDDRDFRCFEKLARTGLFSFLQKPFTMQAFMRVVRGLIHGKPDTAEIERVVDAALEFRRSKENDKSRP
jgi:DNA-binding NtrC family response regulator